MGQCVQAFMALSRRTAQVLAGEFRLSVQRGECLEQLAARLNKRRRTLMRQLNECKHYGLIDEGEYRSFVGGGRSGRGSSTVRKGSGHEAGITQSGDVFRFAGDGKSSDAGGSAELHMDVCGNCAEVETRSQRIRTLDDLIAAAEIDLSVWEIERYVINKWEVGARADVRDGAGSGVQVVTEPLWQVKAWLRRKAEVATMQRLRDELVESLKSLSRPAAVRPNAVTGGDRFMLEISIPDLQAGRLVWGHSTGGDHYDVDIASKLYLDAVQEILHRTRNYKISLIANVVGNDLLNADNALGETTHGTPQQEDSRRYRTKKIVFETVCKSLLLMQERAPVKVLMVPGNHDRETIFDMGIAIKAAFANNDFVDVDNSPLLRKYMHYGVNLIGFAHGKDEQMKSLPIIMATEMPQEWANSQFREWHIAHVHKKKEYEFLAVEEFNGVRVRVLPSLCALDEWTYSKGYRSMRAAEAYLWHYTDGYAGHISVNTPYRSERKDTLNYAPFGPGL